MKFNLPVTFIIDHLSSVLTTHRPRQGKGGPRNENINPAAYIALKVAHLLLYPDAWHRLGHLFTTPR